MLERRRITMEELRQWMRDVPLLVESNRHHLQMDPDTLADWTAAQLVRAGAAVLEDGLLVDR